MKKITIAIVGMCGTGKSVVTHYIEQKFGYQNIYFGGIVVNETITRGYEVTPENERIVREDLRAQRGLAAIAKIALPEIESCLSSNQSVVIDGMYSFSEYRLLKEHFQDTLVVVAVHASKHLRYQRLATRKIRPLTKEEVDRRDYAEIEHIEKGGPIALADYHLINDHTLDDLYARIDRIFADGILL